MTREEDNKRMIEATTRSFSGSNEEVELCLLGTVTTILFDISKSLAIMADKLQVEPLNAPPGSIKAVMIVQEDGSIKDVPLDRVIIERRK